MASQKLANSRVASRHHSPLLLTPGEIRLTCYESSRVPGFSALHGQGFADE
jgi:hypothetical protein